MHKNIEKEYKILLNEEQFNHLLSFYPDVTFHTQVNTYYDNQNQDIRNVHGAMRIREKNGYVFTLKMWNNSDLLEFEREIDGNDERIFMEDDIVKLLAEYHIFGPFIKTCEVITHRAIYITDNAELCFDVSEYNGHRDFEIEYEYKKDHDGLQKFTKILRNINVLYTKNCDSKIKRAMDSICTK